LFGILDDFVLPTWPTSTSRYEIVALEKAIEEDGKRSITRDYETVTVPISPSLQDDDDDDVTQQMLMWKKFSRIARNIASPAGDGSRGRDDGGSLTSSTATSALKEAYEFIDTSLWNQKAVDAIMTSIRENGRLVEII